CSGPNAMTESNFKRPSCSILAMERVIARLENRSRLHSDKLLTIPRIYVIRSKIAHVRRRKNKA
ncbi:MAG: hypothetical protein ACXAEE_12405, partial [Candidatus Thorarchaeota archaeon]